MTLPTGSAKRHATSPRAEEATSRQISDRLFRLLASILPRLRKVGGQLTFMTLGSGLFFLIKVGWLYLTEQIGLAATPRRLTSKAGFWMAAAKRRFGAGLFTASKATITKRGRVWRAAARLARYAITVLACVYVADKIVRTGLFRQPIWLDARLWAWLASLAIAYAASQILLAVAWMALLNARQVHVPLRHGAAIYLRTIVLKYLPSNLLHIAGRYGLTLKAGATHGALLRATLGEITLLLVAGIVVAAAFVFPLLAKILIDFIGSTQAWLVGGAVITALASLALLLRYLAISKANLIAFLAPSVTAFLCYLGFFVAAGAILAALHGVLGPPSLADGFIGLLGLNATAWVSGFIVPGAPGGLGVRESVLIAGLNAANTEAGLALVVGYRIVTVIGDVIATLAGFFIPINQTCVAPIADTVQAKGL
jgi:uncharacterized membrane protein YbhN (UPF0104 family)